MLHPSLRSSDHSTQQCLTKFFLASLCKSAMPGCQNQDLPSSVRIGIHAISSCCFVMNVLPCSVGLTKKLVEGGLLPLDARPKVLALVATDLLRVVLRGLKEVVAGMADRGISPVRHRQLLQHRSGLGEVG